MKNIFLLLCFISLQASARDSYWADAPATFAARNLQSGKVLADRFRAVSLNYEAFRTELLQAPLKNQVSARTAEKLIEIPMPYGGSEIFRVMETPMMEEELAAKYPEIKTYTAVGANNPSMVAKFDIGPYGFNAMVLSNEGRFFIEPLNNSSNENYVVFYRSDVNPAYHSFMCGTTSDEQFENENKQRVAAYAQRSASAPVEFRNYRLALSCTIEYSVAATGTSNPNRNQVLAKLVTSMNRVNGVYETEVAVTMTLVANNDTLIFLPGQTDPFSNADGFAMLGENQTVVTQRIGNANYDIGHVFSTGGGGVAGLGVVCVTGSKARGVTGSPSPVGDAFDIDYVAHEMGHQFAGNHTFNSTTGSCGGGNRSASTAYEPGSGTTIQAYAGICGADDIQPNSDPYFHAISLDEINAFINSTGNSCPVKTNTGNNPPVVNAGADFSIPISTPFRLEGSATDIDGDALTYSWEQMDLGPGGAPASTTGNSPLFRAFRPVTSPARTFPKLNDILTNANVKGERLPNYGRSMKFRLIARDNKPQAGATGKDEMTITVVASAGPFTISSSNVVDTFLAGGTEIITWNVNNTNVAPINCQLVRISLSTDGGQTFTTILKDSTANDGNESIVIPNLTSNTARIKVEAVGNIFFDINNATIRIIAPSGPDYSLSTVNTSPAGYCAPDSASFNVTINPVLGFSSDVTMSVLNLPAGATAVFSTNPVKPGESTTLKISTQGVTTGAKNITIVGTASPIIRNSAAQFTILNPVTAIAALSAPTNGQVNVNPAFNFTWAVVASATQYRVQIASDTTFNTILVDTLLLGNSTNLFRSAALPQYQKLFARVQAGNACGFTANSSINSFTTTGAPLAPSNLFLVSTTATSATIRWTDNSTNESAYRVERSAGNDSTYQVVGNLTSNATQYISSGLTPGTLYYFRVRAANSIGNSPYSNVLELPFAVGIQKNGFAAFKVFPNPSTGEITVDLDDAYLGALQLNVIDQVGRVVLQEQLDKNTNVLQHQINISDLSNGVYMIQLQGKDRSSTSRIVKIQ
jgi:hypothetical protein